MISEFHPLAVHILLVSCPSGAPDPFDNFFGWVGWELLSVIGVNPCKMTGDFIAKWLTNGPMSIDGNSADRCAGLVESWSKSSDNCLTKNLWSGMQLFGYPLVAVAVGARFIRLLAHSNYAVSLSWSFADPLLRAVVAFVMIRVSFPVLVDVHLLMVLLGGHLYGAITATGNGDPSLGITAGVTTDLLVTVIQWVYSAVVIVMVMASMIAFEVCVILAPVLIPMWVYGSDAPPFSFAAKTVGGGLAMPPVVGIGWGVVVRLTHELDSNTSGFLPHVCTGSDTSCSNEPGWAIIMQLIILFAGISFMAKFMKATTGPLFSGHGFLANLFLLESAVLNSGRIVGYAGALMPQGAAQAAYRRLSGWGASGWMPQRVAQWVQSKNVGLLAAENQVRTMIEGNTPLREAVAGLLDPAEYLHRFRSMEQQANAMIRHGNIEEVSEITSRFTEGRKEGLVTLVYDGLDAWRKMEIASQALAIQGVLGVGGPGLEHPLRNAGRWRLYDVMRDPTAERIRLIGERLGTVRGTADLALPGQPHGYHGPARRPNFPRPGHIQEPWNVSGP